MAIPEIMNTPTTAIATITPTNVGQV
jgi:hypothetical protein